MSTMEQVGSITLLAGADLSAKQFTAVDVNSSGAAITVTGAGARAVGVLMNKPTSGQAATVATMGVVKMVAGATVAAGANVQADAAGDAITAASADHVIGVALTGGDDGELIRVLLVSKHILA